MRRRSPSENAHRIASSRTPDLSGYVDASKAASSIPVGHFLAGCDATPDTAPGSHHPFGDNAVRLHALGLVILPCCGDDGKRPSVKGWERPKSAKTVATWAQRFASANIGVACGASGVVVVDVDRPELEDAMLRRFGDTPLLTRTPSGGAHLWYRKLGPVRSGNLRPGLEVDIKSDGGFVVVPPSLSSKGVYAFERGSWDDTPTSAAIPPGGSCSRSKQRQP